MVSRTFDKLVTHDFDFLNIDLEGHDYQVLKTIDFNKYNPKLIALKFYKKVLMVKKYLILKSNNFKFIKQCDEAFF